MSNKDSKLKLNRRKTLKSIGAAVTLSTAGVSVSSARGKPSFEEVLKQSHRVLQAKGPEKQHEFLQKRGIGTAMDSGTLKIRKSNPEGDGVSMQTLTEDEISLTFSLFADCGYGGYPDGTYVAEFSWEYHPSMDDGGGLPMDFVGIGWDNNTWYYEDENVSDLYNSDGARIEYRSGTAPEGPVWEVDDRAAFWTGDRYYTGVQLDWKGTDAEKDNKTISAGYSHTWNDVTVNSVSASFPEGISVGVGWAGNEWTKSMSDSGEFLQLSYNEVGGCW